LFQNLTKQKRKKEEEEVKEEEIEEEKEEEEKDPEEFYIIANRWINHSSFWVVQYEIIWVVLPTRYRVFASLLSSNSLCVLHFPV